MIYRPTIDEYFTIMAMHASSRGSCLRRRVGCVLVDENKDTISTGYNGPPSGQPNCREQPCEGANYPSGFGLHLCRAVHSEVNAINRCRDISRIHTAYVTATPCEMCMDALLKTPCKRIVYLQEYASNHNHAKIRWIESGREIDWIFDLINDESPVHTFANIYGF